MLPLFLACLSIRISHSLIDFTHSTLYDIFDFKGVDEVHIPQCDAGCLIFAATMGDGFAGYPDGEDPYAKNIFVCDNSAGHRYSIVELARKQDDKHRRIPLTIESSGNVSVINVNDPKETQFFTILLYVVEKSIAETISYEMYDAIYTNRMSFTPQSDIVTFISAWPFRINSPAASQANSVTARLAGFDNALDTNDDGCPYAYKTPDVSSFPGFSLQSMPHIMSFAVEKRNTIKLQPSLQFSNNLDLAIDGFIATPGWNGCMKFNHGGFQSFRYTDALASDSYTISSEDHYKVHVDVLPHFDSNHNMTITDDHPLVVTGIRNLAELYFPDANNLLVQYKNMEGDQGFLLRYSSELITKTTTTSQSTTSSTLTSICTTTKAPLFTSSAKVTPTTSSKDRSTVESFTFSSIITKFPPTTSLGSATTSCFLMLPLSLIF